MTPTATAIMLPSRIVMSRFRISELGLQFGTPPADLRLQIGLGGELRDRLGDRLRHVARLLRREARGFQPTR